MHVLHHDIDIEIQHSVDGGGIGRPPSRRRHRGRRSRARCRVVPALLENLSARSVAQSFGSSRSMTSGITASPSLSRSLFSAASSRSTITTRAPMRQHGLRTGQSDARRSPGHDGDLALQFSGHVFLSLAGSAPSAPNGASRRFTEAARLPPKALSHAFRLSRGQLPGWADRRRQRAFADRREICRSPLCRPARRRDPTRLPQAR